MAARVLKILLIEDSAADARLVEEMLGPTEDIEYELRCHPGLASGLEHIDGFGPDVILLDLGLAESSGLDTFERARPKAGRIPIVILSGLGDEDVATESVRKGAQDYLVKGQFDEDRLRRTIRYAIERQTRSTEAEERVQALIKAEPELADLVLRNPDGVLVVDAVRKILFANPAAARLLAVPVDGLVGSELEFNVLAGTRQMIQLREDPRKPRYVEAHSADAVWSGQDAHILTLREAEDRSLWSRLRRLLGGRRS
jgi:CheY-like chemotaxis protein